MEQSNENQPEDFSQFFHFTVRAQTLEDGEVVLECMPDNTELYYHQDQYAEVDHFFHRLKEDQHRRLGAFIWRATLGNDMFNQIANAMIYSKNWKIRFNPVPMEGDMEQYAHQFNAAPDDLSELDDGFDFGVE